MWKAPVIAVAAFLLLQPCTRAGGEEGTCVLVEEGRAEGVFFSGLPWKEGPGYLEGTGVNNELYAPFSLGPGDFTVTARITLLRFERSAAAFFLNRDHFGFDGRRERLFVQGPWFGRTRFIGKAPERITPGRPFLFEAARRGKTLSFRIDGDEVCRLPYHARFAGRFGLRPWRGTLRVHRLEVRGNRVPPPPARTLLSPARSPYRSFRAPVLLALPSGVLLAFCEAAGGDGGCSVLLLRSDDGGETWSPPRPFSGTGGMRLFSPAAVFDPERERVFLFTAARDPRGEGKDGAPPVKVLLYTGTEGGTHWEGPREVTREVSRPGWREAVPGPGTGIPLDMGGGAVRLVVPGRHRGGEGRGWSAAHVIFSDDHGAGWRAGGSTEPGSLEGALFTRPGGVLAMNMARERGMKGEEPFRRIAASQDGGRSWSRSAWDRALLDPGVQAGILRVEGIAGAGVPVVLFSNPCHVREAKGLTLRFSFDEGWTWHLSAWLHGGTAGGSSLALLPGGRLLCLFESGEGKAGGGLSLAAWTLPELPSPPE